jgi:hypothetical protein
MGEAYIARKGMKDAYKMFVGESERRRTLGRRCLRWKDNIKVVRVYKVCKGPCEDAESSPRSRDALCDTTP